MHSSLPSIGNHVVTFAKQYREGELRTAGRPLFRRRARGSRPTNR